MCQKIDSSWFRNPPTDHLKPLLHGCSTLQVLRGSRDIEIDFLLTQVDHMAGEKRLAVFLEVFLILI